MARQVKNKTALVKGYTDLKSGKRQTTRIVNGQRVSVADPFASVKIQNEQIKRYNEQGLSKTSRGKNMARRKKTAVNSPNSVGATGTDIGAMPAASRKMRNARNRAITAGTGAQTRKSGYKPMSAAAAARAGRDYQIQKLNSGASVTSARNYGDFTGTTKGTGGIRYSKRKGVFEKNRLH